MFGGLSAEKEVSLASGRNAYQVMAGPVRFGILIHLFVLIRFVLSDSSDRLTHQDQTKRISAGFIPLQKRPFWPSIPESTYGKSTDSRR